MPINGETRTQDIENYLRPTGTGQSRGSAERELGVVQAPGSPLSETESNVHGHDLTSWSDLDGEKRTRLLLHSKVVVHRLSVGLRATLAVTLLAGTTSVKCKQSSRDVKRGVGRRWHT